MNKKNIIIFMAIVAMTGLFACMPRVRTDLKSYQENPEEYKNKEVVLTTTLEDLLDNPNPYLKKKVEITGFVKDGPKNRNDWYFIIGDKEGRTIKCYEWHYRVQTWLYPVSVLRKAKKHQTEVVVVGRFLKKDRIELDWIVHEGTEIDTDYIPHYFNPKII
jgi:hypothetical protein